MIAQLSFQLITFSTEPTYFCLKYDQMPTYNYLVTSMIWYPALPKHLTEHKEGQLEARVTYRVSA